MEFLRASLRKRVSKNPRRSYETENIDEVTNGDPSDEGDLHARRPDVINFRNSSSHVSEGRCNKMKFNFFSNLRQKLRRKGSQSRRRFSESHVSIPYNTARSSTKSDDKTYMTSQNIASPSKKHGSKSRTVCPLPSPIMCSKKCSYTEDSNSGGVHFEPSNDGACASEKASCADRQIDDVLCSQDSNRRRYRCNSCCNKNPLKSNSSSDKDCTSTYDIASNNSNDQNTVPSISPENHSNDTSTYCISLSGELVRLSHHGWYWGPICRSEAEEKLAGQCDGAFLVRDSSDNHHLLSISFRSFGQTFHTRIGYYNGLFSFYHQKEGDGCSSVIELINQSMSCSMSGIFCYSRSRNPEFPSFPVRLTKPVSRFTHVRSLQYLCRFVIRQHTRFDLIENLPLPDSIKGYIGEGHY